MSNVAPFESDKGGMVLPSAGLPEVFRPNLDGFDFAAYSERQAEIDIALGEQGRGLPALLAKLNALDPETGVTLNNLHNTTIEGDSLKGLNAALAVMTKSSVCLNLPDLDFQGGVASEANFSNMDLSRANFLNAILPRAQFKGTKLEGADFTNVVLNGADFTDATLHGSDFTGAYLVNVQGLTEDHVRQIKLNGARAIVQASEEPTSLEQLLQSRFGKAGSLKDLRFLIDPVPVTANASTPGQAIGRLQAKRLLRGLFAKNANWNQVDFTGSDLTGATIDGLVANQGSFREASLGGVTIRRAMMREFDLVGAWAPGIIIEEANLREARVERANLVGAILRGVDLRGAVGLEHEKTNLEGIVIEDCILPQGYGYDGVKLQMSQKKQRELE